MHIRIRKEDLTLLPEKAIYWGARKLLLVSDLHIGKIAHFRKAGIAVPGKAAEENFSRLDNIIKAYDIAEIIFTGDLFHSDLNQEWASFCEWRKKHKKINMQIVLGNHDLLPESCYRDAALPVHREELVVGPFTLAHHPRTQFKKGEYVICGHIHPVMRLEGKGRQSLRLPCFFFGKQQAVLPSFGYFTGGHHIEPEPGDQVVMIVKDQLMSVNIA